MGRGKGMKTTAEVCLAALVRGEVDWFKGRTGHSLGLVPWRAGQPMMVVHRYESNEGPDGETDDVECTTLVDFMERAEDAARKGGDNEETVELLRLARKADAAAEAQVSAMSGSR